MKEVKDWEACSRNSGLQEGKRKRKGVQQEGRKENKNDNA